MKNIPFIILAGGLAKRLHPISMTIPKCLIHVGDRPFIYHQLDLLHKNNVKHVIICIGHLGDVVETTVGYLYKDINIEYSYDGSTLVGTGGAVKKASTKIQDVFGVLYGDSYLPINYNEVIEYYYRCNKNGLMTVFKNENKYDISNVVFDDNNICKYGKSSNEEYKYIDYGFSIFNKTVFENVSDDVFDLSKIINQLIEQKQLAGFEVFERFYEIGSFKGLSELQLKLQTR